jgi:hypothetical protein
MQARRRADNHRVYIRVIDEFLNILRGDYIVFVGERFCRFRKSVHNGDNMRTFDTTRDVFGVQLANAPRADDAKAK